MKLDYKTIGLEENLLYEVLATTLSIKRESQIIPNTACMGIRILNNNLISMIPYPTTKTFQNINKIPIISINFVDDIFLYALTSLKNPSSLNNREKALDLYYEFQQVKSSAFFQDQIKAINIDENISIPFIKNSWSIIICEVKEKKYKLKEDEFGKLKTTEFILNPILIKKFRESYKLYNRAENLTLEIIILATRLKIAVDKKVSKSLEYLSQYIESIRR
jgi:hypothetical protein